MITLPRLDKEERMGERRTGVERRECPIPSADRRQGRDRRFATMQDKLAAAAATQAERRFSDACITGFGLLS